MKGGRGGRVGSDFRGRAAPRAGFIGNAEADNVHHARNLVLDDVGKSRRELLARELEVAEVHGKREFGEVQLTGTGGVS